MSEETGGENVDLTDFSKEEKPANPAPANPAPANPAPANPAPAQEAPQGDAGDGDNDHQMKTASDLDAVFDVPVTIAAVLGRTHMEVADLLKLDKGDVVELDRKVGEALDIYVNDRLVARGEVVLVEDKLGITMTEIIKGESH